MELGGNSPALSIMNMEKRTGTSKHSMTVKKLSRDYEYYFGAPASLWG